jgi:O-antigen ligase
MEEKKTSFAAIYDYTLGIFSIISILFPKQIGFAFVLFLCVVIVGVSTKHLHFKLNNLLICFALLYITYLLFGLKTNHPNLTLHYFERKSSLLLLPLLFAFRFTHNLPSFEWTKKGYLISLIVLALQSLFHVFYSLKTGWELQGYNYSSYFSYQHHPSYSTAFYSLALCLVWWEYRQGNPIYSLKRIIPFSLLMLVAILFCQSLAGLLFLLIAVITLLVLLIFKQWGKKSGIVCLIISPLLIYMLIQFPPMKNQWNDAKKSTKQYLHNPTQFVKRHKYPMSGSEVRLVMWTVSSGIFIKHPMGVGTGNMDGYIYNYLVKLNQKELAKKDYNPHNQYLQTGIEIGIVGLLLLLGIIAISFNKAFRDKDWLLFFLAANFALNICFESMLQQQSGIVFYTFWLCLLFTYSFKKSNPLFDK